MRFCPLPALLLLGGCGYIGPPQPPARAIPQGVKDLRVVEFGDRLQVTFTIAELDTDGLKLPGLRAVNVYAGVNAPPYTPESWAAAAKAYPVPVTQPGIVMFDQIPVTDWAGKTIAVGARVTGPKGRSSGFSNLVMIGVGQALAAPSMLAAKNQKDGVGLTWRGPGPKYRVLRSVAGGAPQVLSDVDKAEYVDTSAQFGMTYQYRVLTLASDSYMSAASEAVSIAPKDEFPPDVPTGVSAIAGVSSIQVSWDANTEADFRGYNVWRSVDNGPFTQVAMSLETPSYSDTKVESGKAYRYQVSSVDLLGNESARSPAVSARLP